MTTRNAHRSEKGQSLVELSVCTVILLILLAGIVDLGRGLLTFMTLREATTEGLLYGSYAPADHAGIEARVRASSRFPVNLRDPEVVSVAVSTPPNPCTGKAVTVEVTYVYKILTPFLGTLLGRQDFPMTTSSTGTILSPPCRN
jgi:Flp pilus assembly protein TadG